MIPTFFIAKLTALFFAAPGDACDLSHNTFLILPSWWEYLGKGMVDGVGECAPKFAFPGDIWLVGLAILDMLLRVAGFVAVVSIMIAGAQYLFSSGNPEKAAAARGRLYNALIGLAIALTATAVVTYIGNRLAS